MLRTILLVTALQALELYAQSAVQQGGTRIEILGADQWTSDKAIANGAQRLIGNARFKHEGAVMACDSAYIHEDQRVDAFGRISIRQGDTLDLSGRSLHYSGKDRIAELDGEVRLNDRDMQLSTEHLIYDIGKRVATYTGGGTLVSRKENNTLTSGRGSYLAGAHIFIFSDDVVLQGPDRTITGDTLHYTTTSGVARFFGPTSIISGGTRMWCERGSYDTRRDMGLFDRAGRILLKDGQELTGDTLRYDRNAGLGEAWGHVEARDTANKVLVRGGRGRYDERTRSSHMTDRAELVLRMGEDSLFLHADTLFASSDSSGKRTILARRGVRFFKADLQGVCDTMRYVQADSLLRLHGAPALWSGADQITGRRMRIKLRDGRADTLYVDEDAFLASRVDSAHYDQVTGTYMVGLFRGDELHRIEATGTCRTVYHPKEMREGREELIGVNRADCSRLIVSVGEGRVQRITFITRPDATLYPEDQVPEEERILKGFRWRAAERPADRAGIFEAP
ncbi:MAG: hypothetical protein JNL05_03890 [Flavobacteriales bacterium]|nr:hypothetical protein [Flavobacteriales bacterium]